MKKTNEKSKKILYFFKKFQKSIIVTSCTITSIAIIVPTTIVVIKNHEDKKEKERILAQERSENISELKKNFSLNDSHLFLDPTKMPSEAKMMDSNSKEEILKNFNKNSRVKKLIDSKKSRVELSINENDEEGLLEYVFQLFYGKDKIKEVKISKQGFLTKNESDIFVKNVNNKIFNIDINNNKYPSDYFRPNNLTFLNKNGIKINELEISKWERDDANGLIHYTYIAKYTFKGKEKELTFTNSFDNLKQNLVKKAIKNLKVNDIKKYLENNPKYSILKPSKEDLTKSAKDFFNKRKNDIYKTKHIVYKNGNDFFVLYIPFITRIWFDNFKGEYGVDFKIGFRNPEFPNDSNKIIYDFIPYTITWNGFKKVNPSISVSPEQFKNNPSNYINKWTRNFNVLDRHQDYNSDSFSHGIDWSQYGSDILKMKSISTRYVNLENLYKMMNDENFKNNIKKFDKWIWSKEFDFSKIKVMPKIIKNNFFYYSKNFDYLFNGDISDYKITWTGFYGVDLTKITKWPQDLSHNAFFLDNTEWELKLYKHFHENRNNHNFKDATLHITRIGGFAKISDLLKNPLREVIKYIRGY